MFHNGWSIRLHGNIRPVKELKGFEKVNLKPGETQTVTLKLTQDDFSYFSSKKRKWVFEKGDFVIRVGASSQDIRLEETIRL